MKTYATPSAKVIEIDLAAIICLSPSDPDANSTTESLVQDEFGW